MISRHAPIDRRDLPYPERPWPRFPEQLDEYPSGAMITVNDLDDQGRPADWAQADADAARESPDPARVQFTVPAPAVGGFGLA